MVNFCFKIIQFQQRLQCVMNCFQHLNQAERQGAQLSQRGMAVRRPQCVCVWLIVWLSVCSGKKNSRGSKMTNWQESEKGFWQSEHEPKEILHPLILWERSCAEHKLPMVLVFFLQEMRIKSFQLLTLYLSTIGSLTGPSLDLVKFGKLSRWAINGKPLLEKEISKTKVNSKGFYCSQHLLHTNQCTKTNKQHYRKQNKSVQSYFSMTYEFCKAKSQRNTAHTGFLHYKCWKYWNQHV